MADYATLADLIARFPRTLTAEEQERAQVLLSDASLRLSVLAPGLDAAITAGDEQVAGMAKLTVLDMVSRAISAPTDPGIQQETVGPFSVVYRDNNLFLYSRELDDLLSVLMANRAAAVSMRSPGL